MPQCPAGPGSLCGPGLTYVAMASAPSCPMASPVERVKNPPTPVCVNDEPAWIVTVPAFVLSIVCEHWPVGSVMQLARRGRGWLAAVRRSRRGEAGRGAAAVSQAPVDDRAGDRGPGHAVGADLHRRRKRLRLPDNVGGVEGAEEDPAIYDRDRLISAGASRCSVVTVAGIRGRSMIGPGAFTTYPGDGTDCPLE